MRWGKTKLERELTLHCLQRFRDCFEAILGCWNEERERFCSVGQ